MNDKILIATKNAGKMRELRELAAILPVQLRDLNEFPKIIEPEETGTTFLENAVLKADYYASQTKLWSLADDSGLEVAALNGAPGVFSARYAGVGASDGERCRKLLREMKNHSNRRARFVCAVAVADDQGAIRYTAEGFCEGEIAFEMRGTGGFGYDSIFIPNGFSETFGELTGAIKQNISHRRQAVGEIIRQLQSFYGYPT